jgi:hypothetical protein
VGVTIESYGKLEDRKINFDIVIGHHYMKFCPVVPEICRGQVHGARKERRRTSGRA